MPKYTLLLVMVLASLKGYAQFTGGIEDGMGYAVLTQSNCPPLVSNFIFYGGNADGSNDATLTQSSCPPLVSNFIFQGGNADGYSDAILAQSSCPPLVSNFIFQGGTADGYSDATLTQSNCPPLVSDFIFYGGNADGYGMNTLSQSSCPPLTSDFIFYGGIADGFSLGVLQQSICPNNTPLPIDLLDFTAKMDGPVVALKWSTASELNNALFTVERSADLENFEIVGSVMGHGTTTTGTSYFLVDKNPLAGRSYYRLKQTDFNGNFTYPKVVVVDNTFVDAQVKIYPNPVVDNHFNIEIGNAKPLEVVIVRIVNMQGVTVYQASYMADNNGRIKTNVEIATVSSGLHIISVTYSSSTAKKIIIE